MMEVEVSGCRMCIIKLNDSEKSTAEKPDCAKAFSAFSSLFLRCAMLCNKDKTVCIKFLRLIFQPVFHRGSTS